MTIEKLPETTPDLTAQNIAKLAELFPECVTEGPKGTASDRGEPVIDWDLLKQALSDHLVEGPQERYRLDWPGKRQALLTANTPIDKTLRPMREESVDFETTRNVFIEGDNLDALKLLQETYLGEVKMIYIDPPYNTGKDFVYKDSFTQSREQYELSTGARDGESGRLVANPETNGRFHSDWLSMMYPRLKLARNLLRDDGVIFVSIDENEVDNLHRVMSEIFGPRNFLFQITILSNPKGRSQDKYIANCHDYILAFSRAPIDTGQLNVAKPDAEIEKNYPHTDANGRYRELELRNTHREFGRHNRPNLYYPFFANAAGDVRLKAGPGLQPVLPKWNDGFEGCWTWGKEKARNDLSLLVCREVGGELKIYRKSYALGEDGKASKQVKSIWLDKEYQTERGQKRFNELMGSKEKLFQSPKPIGTLRTLLEMAAEDGDLVLDFFGGSGSLADAAIQESAERKHPLRYIAVQLAEPIGKDEPARVAGYETIAELARERIRRAGVNLLENQPELGGRVDIGFRAFRIDSGNFQDTRVAAHEASQEALSGMISHIKQDRTDEDLLFGALLRWGVDITLPVKKGELARRTVWFVDPPADGEEGAAVIACFARPQNGKGGIDTELADAIAALKPLRVLFRDDGFATDATKENVASRFTQLAPDTTLRVL